MNRIVNPNINKLNTAERINRIPIYIFAEIAAEKAKFDPDYLIDLSLGSPDSETPAPILASLTEASTKVVNHGYPRFNGKENLISAVSQWYKGRFGIQTNDQQVLPLLGSKEGLAHLPLVYLDRGDIALIPNPHYPVHYRGCIIAGADIYDMPLKQANNFLPDLDAIPPDIADRAKYMIISYPNNPTGAIADDDFMQRLVAFVRKHNILLVHDLAYSELGFDGHVPHSIFEYMSLDEPAIEFFSFSKTYHMAGWRIGFCVGEQSIVQNLYKLKTNMDYGISGAIQDAAASALSMPATYYDLVRDLYQDRAELVYHMLSGEELGWDIYKPRGAMYMWVPIPSGFTDSKEFALDVLRNTGVVLTPGTAFGSEGDSYVRIALVQPIDKLKEAMQRIIKHYSK